MDIISQSDIRYHASSATELNRFYKSMKEKSRAAPSDMMYAASSNEQPIAAVRVLIYDHFMLIRSLYVHPCYRGQGIGCNLMQTVLNALPTSLPESLPSQIIAIPTPMALRLYQQLGFHALPFTDIPAQLNASYRRVRQGDKGAPVMAIEV